MSWFPWFSKDKPPPPRKGLGQTRSLDNSSKVIKSLAEFPKRVAVLSGKNAINVSFNFPEKIQDSIIVIKTSSNEAVVIYEPLHQGIVKPYLVSAMAALKSQGLTVSTPLFSDSAIIREVRLASENEIQSASSSYLGSSISNGSSLFKEWIEIAVQAGATDIHIGVIDGGNGLVTMRVDGELEPINKDKQGIFTDHDVSNAMKAAFENMSDTHSNNAGTFSDAKSMSCMIDKRLGIPNIRLRFSSQKGFFGPKSVCRILHSSLDAQPMPFESMGLERSQIQTLEMAQRLESGAIIQSGVTGSGKTTASKTFIETHPLNGKSAMYAVADPIEYLLKNVHQIYIQRDLMTKETAGQKDPYSEVIESLMRMDPDLVDVGEVRDSISASAMANVAKTGHVAMATLHTNSIGGIINRLTDPKLGLTRQELTSSKVLGFISYQALLPKLCKHCCIEFKDLLNILEINRQDQEIRYLKQLALTLQSKFNLSTDIFKFKNPMGCSHCNGRGTKGMSMVAEMMLPDDEWLDMSALGNDRKALREWRLRHSDKNIHSNNMNGKLVTEHTIYKAIKNIVDIRNVTRFGPLEQFEVI